MRESVDNTVTQRGRWAVCLALLVAMLMTAAEAKADPAVSTNLSDVASVQWFGPGASSIMGGANGKPLVNAGDVNGDGLADIATPVGGAVGLRGALVLFSPKSLSGNETTANLSPSKGYRIVSSAASPQISNAGDQNGDGVPDLIVASGGTMYLVYGVADPSGLPECSLGGVLRCITLSSLDPSQGFEIRTGVESDGSGTAFAGIGDVNGDDEPDMIFGAGSSNAEAGAVYVLYGGFTPPDAGDPLVLTELPAGEFLAINGPAAGARLGDAVGAAGEGRFWAFMSLAQGEYPAGFYVFDGDSLPETSPMETTGFGPANGFRVEVPPLSLAQISDVDAAGDVNGDGLPDYALTTGSITGTVVASIIYGSDPNPAAPISAQSPTVDQGYTISAGESIAVPFSGVTNIGDLNGDGVPDQIFGAPATPAGGLAAAGAANLVFGARPTPADGIVLGEELTPDIGIAITGSGASQNVGQQSVGAGDLDNDGLVDFWVSAPRTSPNSLNNSGTVSLVKGSALVASATTGLAGSVSTDKAVLGGSAKANGRESNVYFEYGTSDEYGSESESQAVGSNNGVKPVDAEITGLSPDTTYHYRMVIENDLGLKSFGADREFVTNAEEGSPIDPCEVNKTAPGCSDFCKANPSAAGCADKASIGGLIISAKSTRVKRGKSTQVSAFVTSTGTKPAEGVSFCLKAPKKLVKGAKCQKVGQIAPGSTAAKKFKVTVKRKAKKGKKATLSFSVTGSGLGTKTAKVKIAIR